MRIIELAPLTGHTAVGTSSYCVVSLLFSHSFDGLIRYIEQQCSTNFLCAMSDFHLLLFLYTTDVVQLQVRC